jgi:hypothetical protein
MVMEEVLFLETFSTYIGFSLRSFIGVEMLCLKRITRRFHGWLTI